MAPVVLATELLKILLQKRAHTDNPFRHALDLSQPLLVQSRIVQDLGSDAGPMDWRIRVQWPDEDLELRVYPLLFLDGLADDRESSHALPIQTLDNVSRRSPERIDGCSPYSSQSSGPDRCYGRL